MYQISHAGKKKSGDKKRKEQEKRSKSIIQNILINCDVLFKLTEKQYLELG